MTIAPRAYWRSVDVVALDENSDLIFMPTDFSSNTQPAETKTSTKGPRAPIGVGPLSIYIACPGTAKGRSLRFCSSR